MGQQAKLDCLAPLIGELVLESDASLRERRILRTLVDQAVLTGAALWREARSGWTLLGTSGATEGLPGEDQVEAVGEGRLDGNFPPDGHVLVVGAAGDRCALASTGLGPDGELRDLLEALLVLHRSLEGTRPGAPGDLVDMLLAPFGHDGPDSGVPHLPSAETASLFALLEEAREDEEDAE